MKLTKIDGNVNFRTYTAKLDSYTYSCQKCQKFIYFEEEQEMERWVRPVCKDCSLRYNIKNKPLESNNV